MPITYRKTAKGVAEIETRQHGLSPRWRATLILIDGKRNRAVLQALIPLQPDEALATLLSQGFIEVVAAPSPPASHGAAAAEPRVSAGQTLAGRRRDAVRDLTEILGPSAEALAIRIERARDIAELKPLLHLAAQVIANARGRGAAEAFRERHEA